MQFCRNSNCGAESFVRSCQSFSYSRISLHFVEPNLISVFTRTRSYSLSWARWILSILSHTIFLKHILILSAYPYLLVVFFLLDFPAESRILPSSIIMCTTYLAHHILLDFIFLIIFRKKIQLIKQKCHVESVYRYINKWKIRIHTFAKCHSDS